MVWGLYWTGSCFLPMLSVPWSKKKKKSIKESIWSIFCFILSDYAPGIFYNLKLWYRCDAMWFLGPKDWFFNDLQKRQNARIRFHLRFASQSRSSAVPLTSSTQWIRPLVVDASPLLGGEVSEASASVSFAPDHESTGNHHAFLFAAPLTECTTAHLQRRFTCLVIYIHTWWNSVIETYIETFQPVHIIKLHQAVGSLGTTFSKNSRARV